MFSMSPLRGLKDPKDSKKHNDITAYISKKDASLLGPEGSYKTLLMLLIRRDSVRER